MIRIFSPSPSVRMELWAAIDVDGHGRARHDNMASLIEAMVANPDDFAVIYGRTAKEAVAIVRYVRECGAENFMLALVGPHCATPRWKAAAKTLNAGADDCQPYPISKIELNARIKAVAQRGDHISSTVFEVCPGLTFDQSTGILATGDKAVRLTKQEASLFDVIRSGAGRVVLRSDIREAIRVGNNIQDKSLDTVICKLRKKVATVLDGMDLFVASHGEGYAMASRPFIPATGEFRVRRAT